MFKGGQTFWSSNIGGWVGSRKMEVGSRKLQIADFKINTK
jgi:hypothetical protein